MLNQFIKLPTLTNKLILGEVTTVSDKLNMLESFYNKRLTIIKTLQQLLKNTDLALDMYYINDTFYLMTDDKLLSQWCCSNPVIRGELVDACDIQLVTHSDDELTEEDEPVEDEEEEPVEEDDKMINTQQVIESKVNNNK